MSILFVRPILYFVGGIASVQGKSISEICPPLVLVPWVFSREIGAELGASHQTSWTRFVAKLIQQQGEFGTIVKESD